MSDKNKEPVSAITDMAAHVLQQMPYVSPVLCWGIHVMQLHLSQLQAVVPTSSFLFCLFQSMWEMILKSEEVKRKSFSDVDANKDGKIDQKVCVASLRCSSKPGNRTCIVMTSASACSTAGQRHYT